MPGYKQSEVGVIPDGLGASNTSRSIADSNEPARRTRRNRIKDGHTILCALNRLFERLNASPSTEKAVLTAGDGVGTGKVFHYITGRS